MTSSRWRTAARLAVMVAALATGCAPAGPPVGTLAGSVTYRGQPVSGWFLNTASGSLGAGGQTPLGPDGAFVFESPVPVGTYTVFLTQPPAIPAKGGRPIAPGPRTPVPKKYQLDRTSNLTVEVKEGENRTTFELVD